jgi:hypothetical protein
MEELTNAQVLELVSPDHEKELFQFISSKLMINKV